LKALYHRLLPKQLRHDLGEYYTPDWLAEYVIDRAGYAGEPGTRMLDPACGSGTFLVSAMRRMKGRASEDGLDAGETAQAVLNGIVGFDLNPLAVIRYSWKARHYCFAWKAALRGEILRGRCRRRTSRS
jgi:N-6 DNA Methylase